MSDNKRAELIIRYMDRLREKYPEATSEKLRERAESLADEKLGIVQPSEGIDENDKVSADPMPPEAAVPLEPTIQNPKADPATRPRVAGIVFAVITVIGFASYLIAKSEVSSLADGSAIRQNVAEIIATQRLIFAVASLLTCFMCLLASSICLAISQSSHTHEHEI